jgi:suppressor for copper-sensitivity B
MVKVKYVLGALLLGTAIWLASVFAAISGLLATGIIALLLLVLVLLLTFDRPVSLSAKGWVSACLLACVLAVPFVISPPPLAAVAQEDQTIWQTFNRSEIPRLVADGKTVFVDATADWCLTCKANKNLVLTRGQVAQALLAENVVPMVADWTRQDEDIARFLRSNNRFGVPFNIVYGPGAPDGIPLPELLTSETVLNALEKAAG